MTSKGRKPSRAENLQQWSQRIAAKRSSMWVYRLVRRTIIVVLHPYFRVRHKGAEHLDIAGPVIVAPVHRSNLDTPLLAGMGHRRLRALSKESLFRSRLFGAFLSALGAFPVRRGAVDREAVKAELLALLGQRGAQYPAEHNYGHLYEAPPNLRTFYAEADPTNTLNPGVGRISSRKHYA